MSFRSLLVTFAMLSCTTSFPSVVFADAQCYGTVQSVVATSAGLTSVALVPTPPATQNPCPPPCVPPANTGWTYLGLPVTHPLRDLIYSTALAAVLSGKPVYVLVDGSCQIKDFQLKMQ
jgi:hypothetical protein